jgi:hypothetical protein
MARDKTRSKAAYFLVDVSELPADIKAEVLEDANAGGGEFGLRIVEAIHNGPAQQMIYGVYYGPDEDKWNEAKKDLGITSTSIADSEVGSEQGADPMREAAIRQKAEEAALAEADRIRTADDTAINAVTKDDGGSQPPAPAKRR